MWVMTNDAFVSIVQDREAPDVLIVRGRLRGDVARFLGVSLAEEIVTPEADYRFRISARRGYVERCLTRALECVDYPSYKDSIDKKDKRRKAVAMRIWSIWNAEQELSHGRRTLAWQAELIPTDQAPRAYSYPFGDPPDDPDPYAKGYGDD